METERFFKTLMYARRYVDITLLDKGIYFTSLPFLCYENETIETMVERCIKNNSDVGGQFFSEEYIRNLKQCELVPVVIVNLSEYAPNLIKT